VTHLEVKRSITRGGIFVPHSLCVLQGRLVYYDLNAKVDCRDGENHGDGGELPCYSLETEL